jgi:RNA-binding protein Musashi
MFVGGLNWDTTDGSVPLRKSRNASCNPSLLVDGLRNYFSQFGKIDACTIMRDPAGRSRGFAFLTFEDPAAVNKVMVQEHYLDGKIVRSDTYASYDIFLLLSLISRSILSGLFLALSIREL